MAEKKYEYGYTSSSGAQAGGELPAVTEPVPPVNSQNVNNFPAGSTTVNQGINTGPSTTQYPNPTVMQNPVSSQPAGDVPLPAIPGIAPAANVDPRPSWLVAMSIIAITTSVLSIPLSLFSFFLGIPCAFIGFISSIVALYCSRRYKYRELGMVLTALAISLVMLLIFLFGFFVFMYVVWFVHP